MKNRIYFFTGTGNSLRVAQIIAQALPDCELVAIRADMSVEIPADYDRIGFVCPDYSGGPPQMVADFIANAELPAQGRTYVFAVATYGAFAGAIIAQMGSRLVQRNWILHFGTKIWSYPNAVTIYPMIRGGKWLAQLSAYNARRVGAAIRAKKCSPIPLLPGNAAERYDNYMVRIHETDVGYFASDGCIGCGICAKVCPAGNISVDGGKPTFHHRCESCMACIQHCPTRALNDGEKTQKRGRYAHPDVTWQTIVRYDKEESS